MLFPLKILLSLVSTMACIIDTLLGHTKRQRRGNRLMLKTLVTKQPQQPSVDRLGARVGRAMLAWARTRGKQAVDAARSMSWKSIVCGPGRFVVLAVIRLQCCWLTCLVYYDNHTWRCHGRRACSRSRRQGDHSPILPEGRKSSIQAVP